MAKAKQDTDAGEAKKMVTVEALKYHTNAGEEYQAGDTYEVEESALDNLAYLGMAVPVDRAERARGAAKAAKASKPVEPMTTTSRSGRALAKPRKARK